MGDLNSESVRSNPLGVQACSRIRYKINAKKGYISGFPWLNNNHEIFINTRNVHFFVVYCAFFKHLKETGGIYLNCRLDSGPTWNGLNINDGYAIFLCPMHNPNSGMCVPIIKP